GIVASVLGAQIRLDGKAAFGLVGEKLGEACLFLLQKMAWGCGFFHLVEVELGLVRFLVGLVDFRSGVIKLFLGLGVVQFTFCLLADGCRFNERFLSVIVDVGDDLKQRQKGNRDQAKDVKPSGDGAHALDGIPTGRVGMVLSVQRENAAAKWR